MSADEWNALIQQILTCTKCGLHKYRKNAVPGEGRINATLMFVGEAPGAHEDEEGRPFVGAAGKLLTQLIESIGLKREDVYITNVIKCRPPGNRDPTDDEIEACSPYLVKQIVMIKPKVIVALGRHSARFLFTSAGLKWSSMTAMHGRVYDVEVFGVKARLVATYHPAAALYYPKLKPELERDFQTIRKVYEKVVLSERSTSSKRSILDYFKK